MQNRTDFNAEKLLERLGKYQFLNGKVVWDGVFITIAFHKYFDVKICDDLFEFFDTHCHPFNNEEILKYIDALINEEIIFYHRYKFPHWKQRYKKEDLPALVKKTQNKKSCRVFSAMKIYVDN